MSDGSRIDRDDPNEDPRNIGRGVGVCVYMDVGLGMCQGILFVIIDNSQKIQYRDMIE